MIASTPIRRPRHRALPWMLLGVLVFASAAPAPGQRSETEDSPVLERAAAQIRHEQQRQLGLRQQLEVAAGELIEVVEDLESNAMVEAADGRRLRRLARTLDGIRHEHVQEAAEALGRAARAMPEASEPLARARSRIQGAVSRLAVLLDEMATGRVMDEILQTLKAMAEQQEQLLALTREVGEKHYRHGKVSERERQMLGGEQGGLEQRAGALFETLGEALETLTQPEPRRRVAHLRKTMSEQGLAGRFRAAAEALEAANYLQALEVQEEAMAILEQMLEGPADERPDSLLWLRRRLFEILETQQALTGETAGTPAEDFETAAPPQAEAQRELHAELDRVGRRATTTEDEQIREIARRQAALAEERIDRDTFGRDLEDLRPEQETLASEVNHLAALTGSEAVRQALGEAELQMKEAAVALGANAPMLAAEASALASEALDEAAASAEGAEENRALYQADLEPQLEAALAEMDGAAEALQALARPSALSHQQEAEAILRGMVDRLDPMLLALFAGDFEAGWLERLEMLRHLLRRIEALIEAQAQLQAKTGGLGEAGEEAAGDAADAAELAGPQAQLADRTGELAGGAMLAGDLLHRAGDRMAAAGRHLEAAEPAMAAAPQAEAMTALRRARDEVAAYLAELEAEWEQFEALLAEFARAMEMLQRIIRLEEAQQAHFERTGQTLELEEAVAPLAPAQKTLAEEADTLAASAAEAPEHPATGALRAAEAAMGQAREALAAQEGRPAEDAQREALDHLWEARYEAEAYVRELAAELDIDLGIEWFEPLHLEEALAAELEAPEAEALGASFVDEETGEALAGASEGETVFLRVEPAGTGPADRRASRPWLADRDREALTQHFSGALPVEYRESLKAYFEALAGE